MANFQEVAPEERIHDQKLFPAEHKTWLYELLCWHSVSKRSATKAIAGQDLSGKIYYCKLVILPQKHVTCGSCSSSPVDLTQTKGFNSAGTCIASELYPSSFRNKQLFAVLLRTILISGSS